VFFNVTDDCTFWDLIERKDITSCELSFSSTIKVLSGVDTFRGNKVKGVLSVLVRISKINSHKGSTSAWVVDDFSNNTLYVSMALSEI